MILAIGFAIAFGSSPVQAEEREMLSPHRSTKLAALVREFPQFSNYNITVDTVRVVNLDPRHPAEYVVGGAFENKDSGRRDDAKHEALNHGYGSILIFLSKDGEAPDSSKVALDDFIEFPGDNPPQSLAFIDVDRDGATDVVILAGLDDVSTTSVYRNVSGDGGNRRLFQRVFHAPDRYATLLELDGDGRPELLDPMDGGTTRIPLEAQPCLHEPLSAELLQIVQGDYARYSGDYLQFHARHGEIEREERGYLVATNAIANLFLLHRFRILSWDGRTFSDRTDEFPHFLAKRLEFLEKLAEENKEKDPPCLRQVEGLTAWLSDLIAGN